MLEFEGRVDGDELGILLSEGERLGCPDGCKDTDGASLPCSEGAVDVDGP